MENTESPTRPIAMNLSTRTMERNVLKDLNYIDATTKSPKETALADQNEIHARDNHLPVIHTSNRLSDGSDKAPVNKNLLRVATPTTGPSSDDEEFVDCNTTFTTSIIDNTFNEAVPNESFVNSEKRDLSLNVSNLANVFNTKLNFEGEYDCKDSSGSTISSSFIDDSQITGNKSLGGISNELNCSKEGSTVPAIEHVFASQTAIDEAVASERTFNSEIQSAAVIELDPVISPVESESAIQPELVSKSIMGSESAINVDSQEPLDESAHVIEAAPVISQIESELQIEPRSNCASESEAPINVELREPVIEPAVGIKAAPVISPVESESAIQPELVSKSIMGSESAINVDSQDPLDESAHEIEMAPVISPIESELRIEPRSNCATESQARIDVESKEPVIEPAVGIKAAPVISPVEFESAIQPELVSKSIMGSESATNVDSQEPSDESAHVIEVAPVISPIESELQIEPRSNCATESEAPINVESREPVIEPAVGIKAAPVISPVESESAIQPELVSKSIMGSESATNVDSQEPSDESAHVIEVAPVISPIESELRIEPRSNCATESEARIDVESKEPVIEPAVGIKAAPVISPVESESAIQPELVSKSIMGSESATNVDSQEPSDESAHVIEVAPVISPIESELRIEPRSNCATESQARIDVESKEPVIEPAVGIKAAPVISPVEFESAIQPELVSKSIMGSESATNVDSQEPSDESAHVIEVAPVISPIESELQIEPRSNCASESEAPINVESKEPAIEPAVGIKAAPVIERSPVIQPTPIIESEYKIASPNQSPLVIETNSAINVESVIYMVPVVESTILHQSERIEVGIESKTTPPQSAPIMESTDPAIESNPANESYSVLTQSEPTESAGVNELAPENDAEVIIQSESVIDVQAVAETEPVTISELTQGNEALNVTHNSDGTFICQPETTFAANNDEINQTVRIESSDLKSEQELENQGATTIVAESDTFDSTKGNLANKITEFKVNQSFSVDSLEPDTDHQDCSLDSLEIMGLDEPSTPTICDDLTEPLERANTSDLPNPDGVNFKGTVNLNGSMSSLSRRNTYSVQLPQNEGIPSISRKDTYSLLSPKNASASSVSKLSRKDTFKCPLPQNEGVPSISRHDTYTLLLPQNEDTSSMLSPKSDSSCSSMDDITVVLNQVAINSAIVNPIDSSNRIKRSVTFKKSNSDCVDQQSPSLTADESNALASKLQTTPVTYSIAADSNQDHLPEMVLSSNDFDFLQSRGANIAISEEIRRSSLLLRFDPLAGRTVQKDRLASTEEVVETSTATDLRQINQPFGIDSSKEENVCNAPSSPSKTEASSTANASEMSVSLVHDSKSMDNDTNSFTNNIKADIAGGVPMSDKKIKFEYADENIRKKMEEYEATQEILVKRLTEKEKTLAKNCSIIEAYKKALAELVAEKEKLTDHHEVANERLRQERDIHHQHLMSLEITFSDLHKKYERSKEIAILLRERVDVVTDEKVMIDQLVKQQELRYEKLKQHALQQLEYANSTLKEQEKSNSRENSRLKALLKIEEVSRNTMQEQLAQKCKENKELVKICDEWIGGGQRS